MFKRSLATLGAVVMTASLLAACGGSSTKKTSITPQPVSRQTLQDILTVSGELRREETQTINAPTDGRVSKVNVKDAQEVNVGDAIFALDGREAVAVKGDFSFFRTLDVGSDGPDVAQLERILASDGFSPGRVDRTFTEQTRSALAKWQVVHGYGGAKPETDETVQLSLSGNSAGYRLGKRSTGAATILSTATSVESSGGNFVGPIPPARRGAARAVPALARRAATGTPDKPVINVAGTPRYVDEGGVATWTLNADVAPANDTIVALQIGGGATAGDSNRNADYKTLKNNATILAGQTSVSFSSDIFDDIVVEDEEDITVTMTTQFGNDPNYVVGPSDRATITINANGTDIIPQITISADAAKTNEGQNATFRLRSNVELNRNLDIFVNITGSATVEQDYRPLANDYVTLTSGNTEVAFNISPRSDDLVEPDETITVTIVADPDIISPPPYTAAYPSVATVTVESGDVPELNIAGGGEVREGGSVSFTIVATQVMVEDTTINYQVGGSATPGQDYQVLSGLALMRAGASSVTITVRVFSDDVIFYPSDMIVANWPARIGTVAVDEGEFVLQGSPVLNLTEPVLAVKLKMTATQRSKIELGMEADVQLEAGGVPIPGLITKLDETSTIGADKTETYEGTVEATGDLPNVDGATVSIDVVIDERKNVVAVPIAAVLKSGSKNYVRVVTDAGRIKRVLIEVGLTQDEFIEVTKGLTGKELVVVSVTTPTE